jgi:hypothetical protein
MMMRIRWTPILLLLPILSFLIGLVQSWTTSNNNDQPPAVSSPRNVVEGFLSASSAAAILVATGTTSMIPAAPAWAASDEQVVF